MSERVTPIHAETLASKIEKLENFELAPEIIDDFTAHPRMVKALWFLQYMSWPDNYAGGLTKFASDFIAASIDRLGTIHMANRPTGKAYQLAQAIEVLEDLPSDQCYELLHPNYRIFSEAFLDQIDDWTDIDDEIRIREARSKRKELAARFLEMMSPEKLRELCLKYAKRDLGHYFKRLCEENRVSFQLHEQRRCLDDGGPLEGAPWYFADLSKALLDFIDSRGDTIRARMAETEVTKQIFEWMTVAQDTRQAVMISGNSRFGKTESVKLRVEIHPGCARMVKTPSNGGLGDLLCEIGKSLGMQVARGNRDLRERIDHVLRFSHLMLCFDEAQFLLPAVYTRTSPPARLNWIRRAIVDNEMAAVFVCTPQSYERDKMRFVKTTGYVMEQFDERILKTLKLPDRLPDADLFAIVRIHLPPGTAEDYVEEVAGKILATERNFISDASKIGTLAKYYALRDGRKHVLARDLDRATADVLPSREPESAPQPRSRSQERLKPAPPQLHCKPAADALPVPRRGLETLHRGCLARPLEVRA